MSAGAPSEALGFASAEQSGPKIPQQLAGQASPTAGSPKQLDEPRDAPSPHDVSTLITSSAVRAKITESVRESTSCKSALSFPMTKQSSPDKKTTATLQSGLPPLVVEPISRRAGKQRATPSSKDAAGEDSDHGYTSGGYSDYGHAYGTRV